MLSRAKKKSESVYTYTAFSVLIRYLFYTLINLVLIHAKTVSSWILFHTVFKEVYKSLLVSTVWVYKMIQFNDLGSVCQ
jgi:hypothetical protein